MTHYEDFLGQAKKISLTPGERTSIKAAIMQVAHARHPHRSLRLWLFTFKGITSMVVSVFIITTVGSVSASYAAESSVPGDLLYPIKIHVNEGIRGRLASSPESAAAWEAEKADRRLKEVEALVARSSLNATNKAFLRKEFSGNVRAVRKQLVAMNDTSGSSEASDLRSTFSASLQAHSSVLRRLKESPQNSGESIDDFAEDVRNAAIENEGEDNNVNGRERDNDSAEMNSGVRVALMKVSAPPPSPSETENLGSLPKKAQILIDDTNALFSKRNALLSPATRVLAQRKLEIATAALRNAQLGSDHPIEARQLAKTALRNAKEAELILESTLPVTESMFADEENLDDALESERQHDIRFSTDARLQSATRKIKNVESQMESASGSEEEIHDSVPLKTRVDDAKELMDIANTQMKEGNVDDALKTSNMALRRAKEAQDSLEKIGERQKEKQGKKREQKKEEKQKEELGEKPQKTEDD